MKKAFITGITGQDDGSRRPYRRLFEAEKQTGVVAPDDFKKLLEMMLEHALKVEE
jgi:hypothetical protein